jgi:maleate isomerase
MYGWRGRIGLILPNVNTVMEPEFNKVLPEGISCHTTRTPVYGKFDLPTLIAMADGVERAAKELSAVADVICYGCTSGSFAKGPGWDQELTERIQNFSGIPATTTSSALVNALKAIEAERISLVTPYTQEVTLQQKEFLENLGFKVENFEYLNVTEHGGQGVYYPSTAYRLASHAFNKKTEAMVISCTGFRTFEIIKALEDDLRIPVITSNQASLWQMFRILKLDIEIKDLGKLFTL